LFKSSFFFCSGEEWFAFGCNDYGELGLGHKNEILVPTKVPPPSNSGKWISFFCGEYFTIAISSIPNSYKFQTFVFGSNDYAQLGLGHKNNPILLPAVLQPSEEYFIHFFIGSFHAFGQTNENKIYCWGRNDYSQLGLGHKDEVNTPTLLKSPPEFVKIFCGLDHTIALTSDNKAYSFGRNDNAELGFGNQNDLYLIPTLLSCFSSGHFIEFSLGWGFTIALTSEASVYVFGKNDKGQLGLNHRNDVSTPTLLNGKYSKLFGSGNDFSCTQSTKNEIFIFGNNQFGQLGIGNTGQKLEIQKLNIKDINLENIKNIFCGYQSIAVQTKENKCFVFGWNAKAQLGLGTKEKAITIPTEIKCPKENGFQFFFFFQKNLIWILKMLIYAHKKSKSIWRKVPIEIIKVIYSFIHL